MARQTKAEEAILLASSSPAVADYLVNRGESSKTRVWDAISAETEAALLERGDRLIDLRLAEYCLHQSTAQSLFQRDATDWPVRSLVLSNQGLAAGLIFHSFPQCVFGGESALTAYLSTITPDELSVLFTNPTLDNSFLENVLSLGNLWQAMPEQSQRIALSSLASNPKLHKEVSTSDHAEGFGWYMAGKPFAAAWRLVINLEPTAVNATHLSHLYDRLAPYCLQREGILASLPRWVPQSDDEARAEVSDNEKVRASSYQDIRRAAAAMLLASYEVKQEALLDSEDMALRGGAYVAGKFTPQTIRDAVKRDGWFATESLMRNAACWRTEKHRDALHDGLSASDDDTIRWEYRRWADKFAKDHPNWFEDREANLELEDRPLSESSTGELARHIFSMPAFASLDAKLEHIAQSQKVQLCLLAAILATLLYYR
jgi:hypothetical protein